MLLCITKRENGRASWLDIWKRGWRKHVALSHGESLRQVKVPPTPPVINLLSVNKYFIHTFFILFYPPWKLFLFCYPPPKTCFFIPPLKQVLLFFLVNLGCLKFSDFNPPPKTIQCGFSCGRGNCNLYYNHNMKF